MLHVCETVYDGRFDQPKTKRSARTIGIGTETAEILVALRLADVDPKALVFATREGLPLERWNLFLFFYFPSKLFPKEDKYTIALLSNGQECYVNRSEARVGARAKARP
ncbi:MAG TPA: hypothetical protein VF783_10930 [Terriglobales bacterium]